MLECGSNWNVFWVVAVWQLLFHYTAPNNLLSCSEDGSLLMWGNISFFSLFKSSLSHDPFYNFSKVLYHTILFSKLVLQNFV